MATPLLDQEPISGFIIQLFRVKRLIGSLLRRYDDAGVGKKKKKTPKNRGIRLKTRSDINVFLAWGPASYRTPSSTGTGGVTA